MKKGMKYHNCRNFITTVNQGINAVIAVATVHMGSEKQEQGMKECMQTYADLCAIGGVYCMGGLSTCAPSLKVNY